MLIETVDKYYNKEIYDLNCAETMIYAGNEEYDMHLNQDTLKTMAAFGGGMAIESVCGAITGSLAIIGILFTKGQAHESDKVKLLTIEFIDKFKNKLNTINCRELKGKYKTEDIRCSVMMNSAGEILDYIIKREKKLL